MARNKPTKTELRRQVFAAAAACHDKKAENIAVLELDKKQHSGFTDFFLICSGGNPRQIQAIADDVQDKLAATGLRAAHIEGYQQAEWVLVDFVNFVVHIFSEKARAFYDLERLWKSAKRVDWQDLQQRAKPTPKKRAASKAPAVVRQPRPRKMKVQHD